MKIKPLCKNFIKPEYKKEFSAGMDIYLQEDTTLIYGIDNVVNLGFASEIPNGYVALLLPRSGTGIKGIGLRNTVGVIDADYRGEWIAHIKLDDIKPRIEVPSNKVTFKRGERLLQCLILPYYKADIELTDTLSNTDRGTGGFGSTN